MVTASMLAWAVLVGVPWVVVAVIGAAAVNPIAAALLLVAFAAMARVRRRTGATTADEAAFHGAVAAELRSGASLRIAVVEAGRRVPHLLTGDVVHGLRQGRPLQELTADIASALPTTGRLFAPALLVAAAAGGHAAGVFERLALRAADEGALARERRTASAQARLSAWIVGGLPVIAIIFGVATGRLGAFAAGAVGLGILVVGLVLVGSGVVAVVLIIRRSAS